MTFLDLAICFEEQRERETIFYQRVHRLFFLWQKPVRPRNFQSLNEFLLKINFRSSLLRKYSEHKITNYFRGNCCGEANNDLRFKKNQWNTKKSEYKKITSVLVSGEVREPLCRGGEPIKESWDEWFLAEINKQHQIKTGTQGTSVSERKFYWKLAFFLLKKCGGIKARNQSEIGSRLVAFYTVSARCQLWIMSINQNCHKLVPILFFQLFLIWFWIIFW